MWLITTWRIFLLLVCLVALLLLVRKFRSTHATWDSKTRAYWYALVMWTFASLASVSESLYRHLPYKYSIVLSTSAALATLVGAIRKSPDPEETAVNGEVDALD